MKGGTYWDLAGGLCVVLSAYLVCGLRVVLTVIFKEVCVWYSVLTWCAVWGVVFAWILHVVLGVVLPM